MTKKRGCCGWVDGGNSDPTFGDIANYFEELDQ